MTGKTYHKPALLEESIRLLEVREGGIYVDATFGGGGHTREIIQKVGSGRVIAFDKDPDAIANSPTDPRFILVRSDFRHILSELEKLGIDKVNGILADLGISSHQVDEGSRGFSFRQDAPLDMRMDPSQDLTAADIVNNWQERDLRKLFSHYGELPNASRFVKALLRARNRKPVENTAALAEIALTTAPPKKQKKYLSQVFQALRIEVNSELEALAELLGDSGKILEKGGRLVIISYHSLEDRMVKNFFRYGNLERDDRRDIFGKRLTEWQVITRKAIQPDEKEVEENPRARSARLRAAEKMI